jgi:cytochrome c oxidase subunit IV
MSTGRQIASIFILLYFVVFFIVSKIFSLSSTFNYIVCGAGLIISVILHMYFKFKYENIKKPGSR